MTQTRKTGPKLKGELVGTVDPRKTEKQNWNYQGPLKTPLGQNKGEVCTTEDG